MLIWAFWARLFAPCRHVRVCACVGLVISLKWASLSDLKVYKDSKATVLSNKLALTQIPVELFRSLEMSDISPIFQWIHIIVATVSVLPVCLYVFMTVCFAAFHNMDLSQLSKLVGLFTVLKIKVCLIFVATLKLIRSKCFDREVPTSRTHLSDLFSFIPIH